MRSTPNMRPRPGSQDSNPKDWIATAAARCALAFAAAPVSVLAQEATAEAKLPEIVVEGATLEVPKKPKPAEKQPEKSAAPPAPQEDEAPPPKKQAKSGEGGSGGSGPGPAPAATGQATPVQAAGTTASGEALTGIPASQIGSSVTVVTGAELKAQQITTAVDALRSLPGVNVSRSGSVASLTQVRIRGAEGNHTIVLIDGIEANDSTNGEFDFSDLTAENIERIEVIRGPQSGLYGSGAIGGVINITTKGGKGPFRVSGRIEGGSLGTHEAAIGVSGGTETAHAAIGYSERTQSNFNIAPFGTEDDPSKLKTFSFNGGVRLMEGLTVDFTTRNSKKDASRDGFGGPVGQLATAIDDASTIAADIWLVGGTVRWDMFNGALTHELRTSYNKTRRTDNDQTPGFPFKSESMGQTKKLGYLLTYRFDTPLLIAAHHTVTGLVEKTHEGFTPLGDFGDGFEREREQVATAFEYRGEFAKRLFASGTVRKDDNDSFKDFTLWRTTAALKLPEIFLRPHASAGTGVKLPSQFEQFGQIPRFFNPNPNLKPEESFGWDAGVEFEVWRNRAFFDLTYFNEDLTNKITTVGFPQTPVNAVGTSTREGVEVSIKALLMPGLTIGGAYTYLDAADPLHRQELRRPMHSGRADLTYLFDAGRGTFNLAAAYNGRMVDGSFLVLDAIGTTTPRRSTLGDYWLVSAAAAYKITPGLEVYGRVENALDQKYQEVFGYAAPGLQVYGGVRISYDEDMAKTAIVPAAGGQ